MNFCPEFFKFSNLEAAVNLRINQPPPYKYDVSLYENQAEIFLHEMFHVDIISNVPPNTHVSDLWIEVEEEWEIVYGPEMAKILARIQSDPGQWVMQSADNLMHFAMTLYYQSLLHGEYPSRPFAGAEPDDGKDPETSDPREQNLSMFDFTNNTLQVSNQTAFAIRAQKGPPTYDAALGETPVIVTASAVKFAAATDYPASYQSSLSSWKSTWDAYLATATASSSSPSSSTPTTTTSQLPSALGSPIDMCIFQYDVLFDHFSIQGKNFDAAKFGKDGSGLKKQIQGCGDLTRWHFQNLTNSDFDWVARGNLPIATKACVGRAVLSVGGAEGCSGTS